MSDTTPAPTAVEAQAVGATTGSVTISQVNAIVTLYETQLTGNDTSDAMVTLASLIKAVMTANTTAAFTTLTTIASEYSMTYWTESLFGPIGVLSSSDQQLVMAVYTALRNVTAYPTQTFNFATMFSVTKSNAFLAYMETYKNQAARQAASGNNTSGGGSAVPNSGLNAKEVYYASTAMSGISNVWDALDKIIVDIFGSSDDNSSGSGSDSGSGDDSGGSTPPASTLTWTDLVALFTTSDQEKNAPTGTSTSPTLDPTKATLVVDGNAVDNVVTSAVVTNTNTIASHNNTLKNLTLSTQNQVTYTPATFTAKTPAYESLTLDDVINTYLPSLITDLMTQITTLITTGYDGTVLAVFKYMLTQLGTMQTAITNAGETVTALGTKLGQLQPQQPQYIRTEVNTATQSLVIQTKDLMRFGGYWLLPTVDSAMTLTIKSDDGATTWQTAAAATDASGDYWMQETYILIERDGTHGITLQALPWPDGSTPPTANADGSYTLVPTTTDGKGMVGRTLYKLTCINEQWYFQKEWDFVVTASTEAAS